MTMPIYVPPEQVVKDKADYARKGIARGRSVVVMQYESGILFVAQNHSRALHKISEIYDRIAFAAVGKYNEFEGLRVAGVQFADVRGYAYDRTDVTARSLANAYAQALGNVFTQAPKPFEVELIVAEVADQPESDQIYRLTFDGSVADEQHYAAMGGSAESISQELSARWQPGLTLHRALRIAVDALAAGPPGDGTSGSAIDPEDLEVAALDRSRPRRKFQRIGGKRLADLLAAGAD